MIANARVGLVGCVVLEPHRCWSPNHAQVDFHVGILQETYNDPWYIVCNSDNRVLMILYTGIHDRPRIIKHATLILVKITRI